MAHIVSSDPGKEVHIKMGIVSSTWKKCGGHEAGVARGQAPPLVLLNILLDFFPLRVERHRPFICPCSLCWKVPQFSSHRKKPRRLNKRGALSSRERLSALSPPPKAQNSNDAGRSIWLSAHALSPCPDAVCICSPCLLLGSQADEQRRV